MNLVRKFCVMGIVEVVEPEFGFGEGPWPLTAISLDPELSPKRTRKTPQSPSRPQVYS